MRALALSALLVVAAFAGVAAPANASATDASTAANTGTAPDGDTAFDGNSGTSTPPDACTAVSFYTIDTHSRPVTIGYGADANTSVFFVLTSDGEVVGHTDLQTVDRSVAVDGQPVPLERNLTGLHTLTVTPHVDSNGNGEFDAGTDESCGASTGATTTWFFPDRGGALDASFAADTAVAGARTTHHATYRVGERVTVETLAVDYRRLPASYVSLLPNASDVNASVRVEAGDGTTTNASVAGVSFRHAFLLVDLAEPRTVDAGERIRLDVAGVANPRRGANSSLVVNPESTAWTADALLDVRENGPVSDLALFPASDPSPPPLKVGFSAENDTNVGFAAYSNGELVGASEFATVSAGSIVDGFEVPVTADLAGDHRVTVYAVRDSNGNGEVDSSDRPYVHGGEDVASEQVLSFGGPTGTLTARYSPDAAANVSGVSLGLVAAGVGTAAVGTEDVTVSVTTESGETRQFDVFASGRGPGPFTVRLHETAALSPGDELTVRVDGVAAAGRADDVSFVLNPQSDDRTAPANVSFDGPGSVSALAFYTGYDSDPTPIRVGYSATPNTTYAFALYADGELVGHTDYRTVTADSTIHADGLRVPLEHNFTGEVNLTVVALSDANGNGQVDAADEPFREGGERVAASTTFDFGDAATTRQSPTEPSGPTDEISETSDPSGTADADTPGFGVLAALAAVTAALLAAFRR